MSRTNTSPAKAKHTDRNGRRNPRVRPKDPETGEPLLDAEETEHAASPDRPAGGFGNSTAAEKALYIQKAEQTLRWQQLKNEKAEKELQAKLGNLVDYETMKREILAANQIVKQQILAVIERENLPREAKIRLKHNMVDALNELAYEQHSPGTPAR